MKIDKPNNSIYHLIYNNTIPSILTCVYVFAWFTQIGKRISFFDTIRFEFVLGAVLAIIAAWSLLSGASKSRNPLLGISIVLVIYFGLFTVFSVDRGYSWNIYFNRVIKFSMMAVFIAVFIDNIDKLKLLLLSYFFAAFKSGQEGFYGWVTGNMVWESQGIPRLHGSIDMYGHPNSFSGFAVCLLPFIYNFYPICNKWIKAGLVLLLIFAVVIIIFTGSRTGYVAVSMISLWTILFKFGFKRAKSLFVSILCIATLIAVLPDSYKDRFSTVFTQEDMQGGSISARKQIIFDSFGMFFEYPMGVGVGAFPIVRQDMFGRSQNTHNLYLEVLTNTGVIGLIIFSVFVFMILRVNKFIITSLSSFGSDNALFLKALSRSIIGYIWLRLMLGLFGMDMYEIYWWFALGLTIVSYKLQLQLLRGNGAVTNRTYQRI